MVLVASVILFGAACQAYSQEHIFTTGPVQELDRCASIWLIKRYVDQDARFEIHPENELATSGTPFDIPVAELRRTHNMSTFEVIQHKYAITNSKVDFIGRLIHEGEINFLAKTRSMESLELERDVQQLLDQAANDQEAIDACLGFFDAYENPNKNLRE